MRILILTRAFNSLSQRLFVELEERGHIVSVEYDINERTSVEAIDLFQPDLIVGSFLTRKIPASIWRRVKTLIVHPGPVGDRGPSSLDWAILEGAPRWGVTVLQADDGLDTGPVWASRTFAMRAASKSSIYRNEVSEAAVTCVLEAVAAHEHGRASGPPSAAELPRERGTGWRPRIRQEDRGIDWHFDDTETVLRKIRSADSQPGLRDTLLGCDFRLYDAHPDHELSGRPGQLIARCGGAVCRATVNGAVWIGKLRPVVEGTRTLKLPATRFLDEDAFQLPEIPHHTDAPSAECQAIRYVEEGPVGYLHFNFYNGAMSTEDCRQLIKAYKQACARPTRVLVLMGGTEFWSNGIDLVAIQAAPYPAYESWENINAIDDLSEAIINTTDKLVLAAIRGNAAAGGVFLALAADQVMARDGVVLNPHYRNMGNLYGSELWTYLMPRRLETEAGTAMMERRQPVGTAEALRLGLIDQILPHSMEMANAAIAAEAQAQARDPSLARLLRMKANARQQDEMCKPLAAYREEELAQMHWNFFGPDPDFHEARKRFVLKEPPTCTPPHLALHRRQLYHAEV